MMQGTVAPKPITTLQTPEPKLQALTEVPPQPPVPVKGTVTFDTSTVIMFFIGIVGTVIGGLLSVIGVLILRVCKQMLDRLEKVEKNTEATATNVNNFKDHVAVTYRQKAECKLHETESLANKSFKTAIALGTKVLADMKTVLDGLILKEKESDLAIPRKVR